MKNIIGLLLMVLCTAGVNAQNKPSASERADLQVNKIAQNITLTNSERQMLAKKCLQFQKDSDALRNEGKKMNETEYKKQLTALRNSFYSSVRTKLVDPKKIATWDDMNKNRNVHK